MKYIDEFRDHKLVSRLAQKIKDIAPRRDINIMEVCGTHTQSFRRFGLNKLLPGNIRLIAGPGCPVCVSSEEYIEQAIRLARDRDTLILTFGDMLRVPGVNSTLEKERARGADISVVYSPWDSLQIARQHPGKKVVFLAVGFETTAPTIALSILWAKKEKIKNLYFFSALKLIPPAMDYLVQDPALNLQGFLCPGHVSTIIGTRPYEFIPEKHGLGCCVSGFEPLDILEGIYLLIEQIVEKRPRVENQYARVVKKEGNPRAKKAVFSVFQKSDACWRGLGKIPGSGLAIRKAFLKFDAEKVFQIARLNLTKNSRTVRCRCADILKGLISPLDCPLFSRACTPEQPIGPCMVSSEGACNAYYRYKG